MYEKYYGRSQFLPTVQPIRDQSKIPVPDMRQNRAAVSPNKATKFIQSNDIIWSGLKAISTRYAIERSDLLICGILLMLYMETKDSDFLIMIAAFLCGTAGRSERSPG